MNQNLVDNDLEKQRRYQREELQKERCDKDFAELMPVFVNGAEKPGNVEPAREFGETGSPCHDDDTSVTCRLELLPRHQFRTRCKSRLHQNLIIAKLTKNKKAAVAPRSDRRHRHRCKPLPID